MLERLERLAADLQQHGHTDAATLSQRLVHTIRESGVQDNLLQLTVDNQTEDKEIIIDLSNGREIRKRLIKILSEMHFERGEQRLNVELANRINLEVGRHLKDDFPITELRLRFLPPGAEKEASSVDPIFRGSYGLLLSRLEMSGRSTIGSIRDFDSRNKGGVGPTGLKFFQTAFARPQADIQ